MGNLIATTLSVFVPLFNNLVTVPYIFHPNVFGGVPWTEPNWIVFGFVTYLVNLLSLSFLATMSGIMSTKTECNKTDWFKSFKRSFWFITGYIIGNIVLWILPFLKAPFLPFVVMIPYGGWLLHGAYLSVFMLIFGALGNQVLRDDVCR